jgi:hypothetical protein
MSTDYPHVVGVTCVCMYVSTGTMATAWVAAAVVTLRRGTYCIEERRVKLRVDRDCIQHITHRERSNLQLRMIPQ